MKCVRMCLPGTECNMDSTSRYRDDSATFYQHSLYAIIIVSLARVVLVEAMDTLLLYTMKLKYKMRRKASGKAIKCFFFLYCLYVGARIAVKSPIWTEEGRRLLYDR